MTSAEIYKLRTHRSPLLCTAVLLIGVLAPSIVLIWYTPKNTEAYAEAYSSTFGILSLLLAIVFGGWLLGTEYRQGTVKRLLASEPRRLRAMATKGIVGAGALSAVMAIAGIIGWSAARYVGSMNDVAVPWEGRTLLGAGVTALIAATVSFSLSAVTRSDSFAMVGSLALMLIVQPLVSLIPKVGKYSIGSAMAGVEEWVTGASSEVPGNLSTGSAMLTMAVWLAVFVAGGATLFAQRDV